jgi:predicted lipoprotein with Yx(FWY)xxD motif
VADEIGAVDQEGGRTCEAHRNRLGLGLHRYERDVNVGVSAKSSACRKRWPASDQFGQSAK